VKVVCAWYGSDSLDDRLLQGLQRSMAKNAPLTPFQVILTNEPGETSTGDRFAPKIKAWRNATDAAAYGDILLFIDADCIVLRELRSLEAAMATRYTVAHAPRAGRFPYNVGVVAVCADTKGRQFMHDWYVRTKWHSETEQRVRDAKRAHGSTDQAAFADVLSRFPGDVLELPDKVWNLCQGWERLDDTTRIVHYRGKCSRKLLKGADDYPKRMTQAFREYVLCDTK